VSDTTKYRERSGRSRPPESRPVETPELQARIPCRGRTAGEILSEVAEALSQAAARGRDPLIVLEDLGQLRDSVSTLIKGLSRLLVGYPRNVTFWESSGYTEAFLSVMEGRGPHAGS